MPCAPGRLIWAFLRVASITYTAPGGAAQVLCCMFPPKPAFPCLFRQFMVLCHTMLITATTAAASVLCDSGLNCCPQLWYSPRGHLHTPGTSHKPGLPVRLCPSQDNIIKYVSASFFCPDYLSYPSSAFRQESLGSGVLGALRIKEGVEHHRREETGCIPLVLDPFSCADSS